jgi:hypothetical protein
LISAGYGTGRLLQEGQKRVTGFSPTHERAARPATGLPPLAQRLVLVLVEGLQPDDVRMLPSLDWLAQKGASLRLTVPEPGYTMPSTATLLTGASPSTHGILLAPGPGQGLATDNLVAAAKRVKYKTGGAGGAALGNLLAGQVDQWQTADSLDKLRELATPLLASNGPRLVLLQTDYLKREGLRLHTTDRNDALYRQSLAGLDAQLAALMEQVDWNSTAFIVAGLAPGGSPEAATVPMLLAGPGVTPAYRGTAFLTDLAPTVAAVLGTPVPMAAEGAPLLDALSMTGRPADLVTQKALESRRAFTEAALLAMGSQEIPPDPPAEAADAPTYKQQLDQLLRTARFASWKASLLAIAPYAAGALLAVLLYLILVWRHFGGPAFVGTLTYGALFHVIFFLTGGRYSFAMPGLDAPDARLVWTMAGRAAAAMAVATIITGHLMARRGVKKRAYVATAAYHMALSTALVVALPVAGALAMTGWEFPVTLPSPRLIIWFFVAGLQVMAIGYLSPVWAVLAVSSASVSRRFWPPKEIGDPERNADKVVRMKALKRQAKR